MRFLRKFNEAVNKKELKEFCEEYLAYLIDEGFEIEIVSEDGLEFVRIYDYQDRPFQWSDVKEHFIPFLRMLELNYNLEDKRNGNLVCFDYLPSGHRMYNLNQILNDNLRNRDKKDTTLRGLWVYNIRSKK
jgi:hypothetical protein